MGDATPVIYSSRRNGPLAYAWKVIFNETAKIPAFSNVLPELNHNEMTGFASRGPTANDNFDFIFLKDELDDAKIIKRMDALEKLYKEKNLSWQTINLNGANIYQKIFFSFVLAHWAAYHKALITDADPDDISVVEKFKKIIV